MTADTADKNRLKGLYAITDQQLITEQDFSRSIELALQGGARIIQYRDKSKDDRKRLQQASDLSALCRKYHATSIINDDIALAKAVNADGVHLGRSDNAISSARRTLGSKAIIGISCYNNLDLAIEAEKNTADYVAFGAMFSSPTKPEASSAELSLISDAKEKLSIPVCAIGGIATENIHLLIQHGVDMAAVISCLFAADDIKTTAGTLSHHFKKL